MLWIKALHIIFVVCWFSGIFYLPRLFVNSAMAEHDSTREQLNLMQHKLYRFMTGLAVFAVVFGLILLSMNWQYYMQSGWMHAKLLLIVLLIIYHVVCGRIVKAFAEGRNEKSHTWYRVFNEIPVLLLFAIVILAVVRPF
jgi:putative membrane protein